MNNHLGSRGSTPDILNDLSGTIPLPPSGVSSNVPLDTSELPSFSSTTRVRAGTLPSTFNSSSSFGFDFLKNGSSNSLTVPNNNNNPIKRNPSPLLSSNSNGNSLASLNSRDPFGDIFGSSNSASSSNTVTASSNNTGASLPPVGRSRRLRSGSLFGFDNNIWGHNSGSNAPDLTTLLQNEPIGNTGVESGSRTLHHHTSMQQISNNQSSAQTQQAQPTPSASITKALPDFSRIRSYTTTNALSDKQYHLTKETELLPIYSENVLVNNNNNYYDYNTNSNNTAQLNGNSNPQINQLLLSTNNILEVNRPRSQTYSLGTNEVQSEYYNEILNKSNNQQNTIQQSYQPHQQFNTNPLSPIGSERPILVDQTDLTKIEFNSTFQVSTLSPTNTILILNLPPKSYNITTASGINKLVSNFGKVRGIYVFEDPESKVEDNTVNNNCGTINEDDEYQTTSKFQSTMCSLIEFDNVEMAMHAKAQLIHKELYPNFSCIIGFAKILYNQYSNNIISTIITAEKDSRVSAESMIVDNSRKNLLITSEPSDFATILNDLKSILEQFDFDDQARIHLNYMITNAKNYVGFDEEYGPLPDPIQQREFDAPKLREIRKATDSNLLNQFEIESIALAMLDEIAELSSDYLGNTVVQKIFEISSEEVKDILLKKIAPYIAQMGIHKNGTWAGQKIINTANTNRQKYIIKQSLMPYVAPLFKDGFGNYLIQGCLKFGFPYNDFVFEAICSKFWVLAQDRYGSRAIRAVLESGNCTIDQTGLLASLIVVYAEFLAINNNGALLLTWYLDTCTLKDRHLILTKKLIPWLIELSYNKLGSLTILKILNNRNDTRAGELILKTLFGNLKDSENNNDEQVPDMLKQILKEFTYGPTFIYKTLSTPLIMENNLKNAVLQQIKNALIEMKITPYQQAYRRLMDEVGLTSKESNTNGLILKNNNNNINGQYYNNSKPVSPNFNNPNSAAILGISNNSNRYINPSPQFQNQFTMATPQNIVPQPQYNLTPNINGNPQQFSNAHISPNMINQQFNYQYNSNGPVPNQYDPNGLVNDFNSLNINNNNENIAYQNNGFNNIYR